MDEVSELVGTVGRYFADHPALPTVRDRLMGKEHDVVAGWSRQAEFGWTGLGIPEEFGGSGCGAGIVGELLAVCGRHLALEPYVATVALATPLLVAGRAAFAEDALRAVAAGRSAVTIAAPTLRDLAGGSSPVRAVVEGGDVCLDGTSPAALDLHIADFVVVAAESDDGLGWWLLPTSSGRLQTPRTLLDGHGEARLVLERYRPDPEMRLRLSAEAAAGTLLGRSTALVSAYLLGVAERAFEITLDYLRTRRQFGAVIGSFQALQHRAAKLYAELVVGRSVVDAALRAADEADPQAPLFASAAKARTGRLAFDVASEGIQLHGGIGMTAEADIGLYLKAARVNDLVLGHHLEMQQRAGELLLPLASGQPGC